MATMSDFSLPNLSSEFSQLPNQEPNQPVESAPPIETQVEEQPKEPQKKTNQLPLWQVGAVIAVMVLVPVILFLVSSGGPKPSSESLTETAAATPTRTELASPTSQPTPKTTPSVELSHSLLAATPTPLITVTPAITSTPTPASLSNVLVDEIFFEDPQTGQKLDGQLYAGQHVSLRAKVKNSGSADAKGFASYWKYQGNLVGRNSAGSVKAGATAVYDDINSLVYSGVVLKEGDVTIAYFLDPDNALGEANTTDNSKTNTVKVSPTRTDLEITSIELYHPQTGEKVTNPSVGQQVIIKPVVKNLGQDKQSNLDIKWYINGAEVKRFTSKQWVAPGESLVVSEGQQHTFAAGTTKLKAVINPDKAIPETNSGNNEREVEYTL